MSATAAEGSAPTSDQAPSKWTSPLWIGRGLALIAGVLLLTFPVVNDDAYYQNMIILSLVFAIGASGLNIITGFAGYVSLGQGAFVGRGGYTVGALARGAEGLTG